MGHNDHRAARLPTWFALLFGAVVLATMTDVAWLPLLTGALVTDGLLPVLFYPHS
jgi:hypothetical protein